MNIFILSDNIQESATYHCDQHIHKMILESAQIVSTALLLRNFKLPGIYKLAYPNHPCTRWAAESNHNILYVCELAMELESARQAVKNCDYHSSSDVIKLVHDFIRYEFPCASSAAHTPFVFAGPATIQIRPWDTVTKYRYYYRQKHKQWLLDKGAGMSYKGRPVPEFMADLVSPTTV
jgi:Pyrimidine dimer DNA glycosylase